MLFPSFNAPYPSSWPHYYRQPFITSVPAQYSLPASLNAGSGTKHFRLYGDDWYPGLSAAHVNSAPSSSLFVCPTLPPVMLYDAHAPAAYRPSDSALLQTAWGLYPAWTMYPRQPSPPATLNPLLNGEALGGSPLLFDLSSHTFDPRRRPHHSSTEGAALSHEELTQTALFPWIARMVVECDELLPQWTVIVHHEDESPNKKGYAVVPSDNMQAADEPITVHDVLYAIYRMLHRPISQREWHETAQDKATSAARAYTRRCRNVSTDRAFEESQGVRRVDFLLDHYMFGGLVRRRGEQGFEHVILRVRKG